MLKKAILTGLAALDLVIGMTSFVPVSAQTQTATIVPEFPDGTSCAGGTDTVTWPAQSLTGLLGYQVDVYGSAYGMPVLSSSFEVSPDLTSAAFTVPSDIETNGINYVEISAVTAAGVGEPFALSDDFGVTFPPEAGSFDTLDSSVGNGTATVAFFTVGGGVGPVTSLSVVSSPPGPIAPVYGQRNMAPESEPPYWYPLTATFAGLTNGVPYTFEETVGNDCGTASVTSPVLIPADLALVPPQQTLAQLDQPYSQQFSVSGYPSGTSVPVDYYFPSTLPTGLTGMSYDPSKGLLSGTPTSLGTFSFTVCGDASEDGGSVNFNITGGIGCVPFTLIVGDTPSFTSTCPTTLLVGTSYACTVTTSGFPTPKLSEAGALPSGVTFTDNGDGTATLSGTPATGAGGTYPITLTASNGISPNADQAFTLTVDETPSFTTSSPPLTATARRIYSYTFAANGFPAPTFTLGGGAPSWLSINPATGTVSGITPNHPQTFTYSVKATNTVGSVTAGPFTVVLTHGKERHRAQDGQAATSRYY